MDEKRKKKQEAEERKSREAPSEGWQKRERAKKKRLTSPPNYCGTWAHD